MTNPDGTVFDIVNYFLTPDSYARAFEVAGFKDFEWKGPYQLPESVEDPHWEVFMKFPPCIGFSAVKPDIV